MPTAPKGTNTSCGPGTGTGRSSTVRSCGAFSTALRLPLGGATAVVWDMELLVDGRRRLPDRNDLRAAPATRPNTVGEARAAPSDRGSRPNRRGARDARTR